MLVLVAYLSAVGIDCDPNSMLPIAVASAGGPVHSMSNSRPASTPTSMNRSTNASMASDDGSVHGAGSAHHAHHDSQSEVHERAHRPVQSSTLELKPKCVCGCSDTRSSVGGNTSRLGSTLPAVYVPRLVEAEQPGVFSRENARVLSAHTDHDPIPI
jgi:hypothetical protein